MRRSSFLALAGLVLALVVPFGAPANAAMTYDLALQTGHITGTLNGIPDGTAYVRFRLGTSAVQSDNVPVVDGHASFDLETWGFSDTYVDAGACTTSAPNSCVDQVIAQSETFTPSEPTPDVTFPADGAVGPGEDYTLSVSDPDGGGKLFAIWENHEIPISRTGQTTLPQVDLVAGAGELLIWRCTSKPSSPNIIYPCQDSGVAQTVEVDRSVSSSGTVTTPGINPDDGTVTLRTTVSDPGSYVLDWLLLNSSDEEIYGSTEPATAIAGAQHDFDLNLPQGLTEDSYHLTATLTRKATAGDFTSTVSGTMSFVVDGTGPAIGEVTASATSFYPAVDGFHDTIVISADGQAESWTPVTFDVLNGFGQIVYSRDVADTTSPGSASFTWDGRNASGQIVPEGDYTVQAVARDSFGNPSPLTFSAASFRVMPQKLTRLTWTKAVTATDSLVARSVGRCSVLRRPSTHAWAESLGLLSGYRCRSNRFNGLLVSTTHSVRLPALPHPAGPDHYDTLSVKAYGGASRSKPTSTAAIRYYTSANRVSSPRAMSRGLGYHAGYTRAASSLVRSDKSFRWGTYTSAKRRYDVKQFVVTLTYTVLR